MVSSGKIHNSKRSKNNLSSIIRDEHADFKDEMARLRQLRGKVKMRYVSGFLNFRGCRATCCKCIVLSCPRIGSAVLILPRRPKLVQTNGHVVVERDQNLTPILAAQFFLSF